jgi:hypothetical protein|tara:strand:- start:191 stop:724 length:534 start_codon:yes stop_codon:yes gene_type:complete
MKCFAKLECNYLDQIQKELMTVIWKNVDIGETNGWHFLERQSLAKAPSVIQLFKGLRLAVQDFSITVLRDNLNLHIDAMPQVAKINIPVSNTQGWSNVWYSITDEQLQSCPLVTVHGSTHEDVSDLDLLEIDRIDNLDKIIVFNSRIPHSVNMCTPLVFPRIVASFTFINQPLELLQ